MKKLFINALTVVALSLSAPISAVIFFNSCVNPSWGCCNNDDWGIDLNLYGGYVNGKSQEIVYSTCNSSNSQVRSKLDWKINNLWVIGGVFEKTICSIFHLKVDGWTKIHASRSTMVDKDFQDQIDPSLLTDISRSRNTKLTKAKWVSVELGYDFMNFSSDCSEINCRFSVGYQYNHWAWKAYGAKCNYDKGKWIESISDDRLSISYKQNISIPYLALQVDYTWKDWSFLCFGKYTHIAYVTDHDLHALTNTVFKEKFKNGQFWAVGAQASIDIWECLENPVQLTLKYTYEHLDTTRGDMSVRRASSCNSQDDFSYHYSEGAGVNHHHQLLAFGLSTHF